MFKTNHIVLSLLWVAALTTPCWANLPRLGNEDIKASQKIDTFINAEMRKQHRLATRTASDAEFLRRLSLDLTGTIPPAEEIIQFIKNKDREKRRKKIDEYIAHPMFVENLTTIWTNLLLTRDPRQNRFANREGMENFLRQSFRRNKPYDQLVRELLSSEGLSDEVPAVNYVARFKSAPELAGHSARLFMGLQIQCSQCHNHPFEKWTQKDFWGYTAFFVRLNRGRMGMQGDRFRPIFVKDRNNGEARYQVREKPGDGEGDEEAVYAVASPSFFGKKSGQTFGQNIRAALAKLVTSPDNPLFAKSIVNRLWSHMMGRGLVMPIDDLGENNPATHPKLLEWLAKDFVKNGYDLKYMVRAIANSATYQRTSKPRNNRYLGAEYYAYASMKPLTPEQLFNSIMQATGIGDKQRFNHPLKLKRWKQRYLSQYIYNFSNDEEEVVESFQGTIPQALLMMNGQIVQDGIRFSRGSNIERLFRSKKNLDDRIELIFLASLSRRPTSSEKALMKNFIRKKTPTEIPSTENYEAYEDILWALLNTTEFMFNH